MKVLRVLCPNLTDDPETRDQKTMGSSSRPCQHQTYEQEPRDLDRHLAIINFRTSFSDLLSDYSKRKKRKTTTPKKKTTKKNTKEKMKEM